MTNRKFKKIFTNFRVILLLIFLSLAIIAIHPNPWANGVAIRSVISNTSAAIAGIKNPAANAPPMTREVITAINSKKINNVQDYYNATSDLKPNMRLTMYTNKGSYALTIKEAFQTIVLNETEQVVVNETYQVNETINGTVTIVNKTRNKTIIRNKTRTESLGTEDLGLRVFDAPTTNIRKGLDLQGGTRVLLQPEENISKDTFSLLIANMKRRLNVYGLSDVVVKEAGDFFSNQKYIIVEIAGVNAEDVKDLISKQGKFEAKVGNETVFRGGQGDITYVCRSADCSGIDPYSGCGKTDDGNWACRFRFSIALKPKAAKRQANVTDQLSIRTTDDKGNLIPKDEQYLSQPLTLFLDDKFVDKLNIAADLKGRDVTDIMISGSGTGTTEQLASFDALNNMKQLQTIMITGSLPTKLKILKTDNLSAQLGKEFVKNALFIGALAILAVALVVFIRYKRVHIFMPMIATMGSEVLLLLGLAAVIGWNLDLAAIAGIIIAVGTGVDDQIVITDETLKGEKAEYLNWRQKIKKAFFIIMASYFTTVVAMIPLLFAGAGLLKGFALTTIIGVSFGVFLSRPAFAATVEILLKE